MRRLPALASRHLSSGGYNFFGLLVCSSKSVRVPCLFFASVSNCGKDLAANMAFWSLVAVDGLQIALSVVVGLFPAVHRDSHSRSALAADFHYLVPTAAKFDEAAQ